MCRFTIESGRLLCGKCNENQVKSGMIVICIKIVHILCCSSLEVRCAVALTMCSVWRMLLDWFLHMVCRRGHWLVGVAGSACRGIVREWVSLLGRGTEWRIVYSELAWLCCWGALVRSLSGLERYTHSSWKTIFTSYQTIPPAKTKPKFKNPYNNAT
jgi:hypothetical protein